MTKANFEVDINKYSMTNWYKGRDPLIFLRLMMIADRRQKTSHIQGVTLTSSVWCFLFGTNIFILG